MCDTIIATGLVTKDHTALFAKNSDRHPNEAQSMRYIPARKHPAGSALACTYITVPQVAETYAALISQPFWMWGAEMGINEHGLVIGNEATFSKTPANKKPALLGMDLLRLGLERAKTPREALHVITNLLEEFGQGGNNKFEAHGNFYYHNSYLLANHEDAWVLETINLEWIARQIKDLHNISNCLTIQTEWDLASANLSAETFNFRAENTDFIYTTAGQGERRQARVEHMLENRNGEISIYDMLAILRHHQHDAPKANYTHMDICMHAGQGLFRNDQSVASFIAHLDKDTPLILATGTSAPCTSIFKPLWLDAPLPTHASVASAEYDARSSFWLHERLHRAVLQNYGPRLATYHDERDALEIEFIKGAFALKDAPIHERTAYAERCAQQAALAENLWLERVKKIPAKKSSRFFDLLAWQKYNKMAKMPVE
jgi:secernin